MAVQTVRTRVLVASDQAAVRDLISGLAERENETAIVGEAADAATALSLARDLKPDVVILDSSLPRIAGLSSAPLMRLGGLDTAELIAHEIPETSVVLVGNLDEAASTGASLGQTTPAVLTRADRSSATVLDLRDLPSRPPADKDIVFATVNLRPWEVQKQRGGSLVDKVVLFGAMVLALGWVLVLTFVLAPVGVFIAAAGAAAVVIGLTTKWAAGLRRRLRRSPAPGG